MRTVFAVMVVLEEESCHTQSLPPEHVRRSCVAPMTPGHLDPDLADHTVPGIYLNPKELLTVDHDLDRDFGC